MAGYSAPTREDDPLHVVRTIGRIAQMLLELRDEYERRPRSDTLTQIDQRLNDLAEQRARLKARRSRSGAASPAQAAPRDFQTLRPARLPTRDNEGCRRPREAIGIASIGPHRRCSAGAPLAREPKAVNPEVFLPVGLPAPACRPTLASGATRCPGAALLMYVQ